MSYLIGIYQTENSRLADIIKTALVTVGFKISGPDTVCNYDKNDIFLYSADFAAFFPDKLDICILESGYRSSNSFPTASYVIMPDISGISTIKQLCPKSVITYGLSCKNTVTVSSVIRNNMVVSIQRELVTISGARIDAQEFPVSLQDINNVDSALASVALLLQLNIPIEKIKKINLC